jgi:hypothetical protein
MSVEHQARLQRLTGGGTTGNERLTAATGIVLIVLLAVIGVTLVRLQTLISVHLFVGLLSIGPVALKMFSTGYRFMRYYTSSSPYVERGTPVALLRLTAPVVVISTVTVLVTGVALLLVGPGSPGSLRFLHKASFIVWLAFTSLHVLGHLPDLSRTFLRRDGDRLECRSFATGAVGRAISIGGAVVAGMVLAILLVPDFAAWVHAEHVRIDH